MSSQSEPAHSEFVVVDVEADGTFVIPSFTPGRTQRPGLTAEEKRALIEIAGPDDFPQNAARSLGEKTERMRLRRGSKKGYDTKVEEGDGREIPQVL